MKGIIDVGKDIFYEIKETNNFKLLFDLFEVRTKDWKYPSISYGCGTFDIFNDLYKLNSKQGFELISIAVDILNNQGNENLFTTSLSLLLTCIEISNTTEMPTKLAQNWTCINDKVSKTNNKDCKNTWIHIQRWYRRHE